MVGYLKPSTERTYLLMETPPKMTAVYSSPVLCTAEQNLPGFCTVRTAQPNLTKNDRRVQQSCVMYSRTEFARIWHSSNGPICQNRQVSIWIQNLTLNGFCWFIQKYELFQIFNYQQLFYLLCYSSKFTLCCEPRYFEFRSWSAEFWPNLDPDPGLFCKFWKNLITFLYKRSSLNYKKIMAPEIFWQTSIWVVKFCLKSNTFCL